MRLRHMVKIGPSPGEIRGLNDDDDVTFAPMDALADGLGGLDVSLVKPLSEVLGSSYNYFADGDILLAKVTPCFENGKKAIALNLTNGIGFATSEVHVLRPDRTRLDTGFLRYLLCSEDFRAEGMQSMTGAGGLRRVSENGVLNYRPKITDLKTQKAIADFLDRETARIDQLIEKKQRLVELVDEKRSTIVTAAVTGQLAIATNPRQAFDKERTGFWPETCRGTLRPLKRACILNPEALPESTDPDFEFEYIDIGNVTLGAGVVSREPMRFVNAPSRARKLVKTGDVIVSTVRTYLKAVASIGPEAERLVVSTGFAVLRSLSHVEPRFLYRAVQSNPFVESVVAASTGVSYPAINPSTLGRIRIPCPNLETQKTIADFLDRETQHMDNLKRKAEQSITLLREFRAALITAAVTGQIDVATWGKNGTTDRRLEEIEEAMSA